MPEVLLRRQWTGKNALRAYYNTCLRATVNLILCIRLRRGKCGTLIFFLKNSFFFLKSLSYSIKSLHLSVEKGL